MAPMSANQGTATSSHTPRAWRSAGGIGTKRTRTSAATANRGGLTVGSAERAAVNHTGQLHILVGCNRQRSRARDVERAMNEEPVLTGGRTRILERLVDRDRRPVDAARQKPVMPVGNVDH